MFSLSNLETEFRETVSGIACAKQSSVTAGPKVDRGIFDFVPWAT